ncbi:MAG TPA: arsenate reductase ArsC [Candidatus Binatia bacterium]|nr:arsenate reductase ArsC [Candidatus Binatia bacterium]
MSPRACNVLFLCTGNSARSVMAEALLNRLGQGRFQAFSAGSFPAGRVNPFTLELLRSKGFPVDSLRSKSWDEFAGPDAPAMDFIFTVCDNAAGEACPLWPGHPATAHWGFEDPAAFIGPDAEKRREFERVFTSIAARVQRFVALPLDRLDRTSLLLELRRIGDEKPA